jgi:hypothetical protein
MDPTSNKGRAFPPELWIRVKKKIEYINNNLDVKIRSFPTLDEIVIDMGRVSASLIIIDSIQKEIQHYSNFSMLQEWPEELLLMKKYREDILSTYNQMIILLCNHNTKETVDVLLKPTGT